MGPVQFAFAGGLSTFIEIARDGKGRWCKSAAAPQL
jgi:hypothetical protein